MSTAWEMVEDKQERDWSKFRTLSFKLERLRRNQWSDVEEELRAAFPRSQNLGLKPLPIVSKFATSTAAQYVRRPRRDYGPDVSEDEGKSLDALAQSLELDEWLLEVSQRLATHNSQVLACVPGSNGSIRLRAFNPYHVDLTLRDPAQRDLARAAEVVRLRVALKNIGGRPRFGQWVLTDALAYEEWPNGKKVSLFHPNSPSDLSNPLGRIPVVGLRAIDPPDGYWLPDPPEDLWKVCVGASLSMSDLHWTLHWQHFTERVLSGPGAAEAAKTQGHGPDGIRTFESTQAADGDLKYELLQATPIIKEYLEAIAQWLRVWGALRYVSVESLGFSSGITGDAKRAERAEQDEERQRQETRLEAAERRLWRLLVQVYNVNPLADPLPEPRLEVTYHYVTPRQNTLQELQALALAEALGLESVAEEVAKREGVSIATARERTAERQLASIQRRKEMLEAGVEPKSIPGIDKAAGAM